MVWILPKFGIDLRGSRSALYRTRNQRCAISVIRSRSASGKPLVKPRGTPNGVLMLNKEGADGYPFSQDEPE
jgi:hypothetical protein